MTSKKTKRIGFIVTGIMILVIIVLGFSTGKIQDLVNETPYFDKLGWGKDANIPIGQPTSNNYDISPPEIKNFEEKLDET